MTPYHHAVNTALKHGGKPEDYIYIHDWFDETKQYTGDWTHRMLRHHAAGIQWCLALFGHAVKNSEGVMIPTKFIAEQHVMEDCGFIPTVADWTSVLRAHPNDWMLKVKEKRVKQLVLEGDKT